MKNVEYSFYFVNANVLNLLYIEKEKKMQKAASDLMIWKACRTQNSPMVI